MNLHAKRFQFYSLLNVPLVLSVIWLLMVAELVGQGKGRFSVAIDSVILNIITAVSD